VFDGVLAVVDDITRDKMFVDDGGGVRHLTGGGADCSCCDLMRNADAPCWSDGRTAHDEVVVVNIDSVVCDGRVILIGETDILVWSDVRFVANGGGNIRSTPTSVVDSDRFRRRSSSSRRVRRTRSISLCK
jgi:hypothetical protein